MKIILSLFICFLSMTLLAQLPKKVQKNYALVWQDEFNGTKLDTSKWEYRAVGAKRGIGIVRKANCWLDGEGHLVIVATKEDSTYYIGQICTDHHFLPTFGYFECSAKLNTQVGPASSFWLQAPTYGKPIGDSKKAGAEIDICEYKRKHHTNRINHTVHWDGYGEHHQQKGIHKTIKNVDVGFHSFGLLWTAEKYTFYVDGKKTWSTSAAISHVPEYIILSLEMNGWGGDPTNSTFPDQVIFDYVRVYQQK